MRRVADLLADERNVNISSSACNGVKLICDHMQDPSESSLGHRAVRPCHVSLLSHAVGLILPCTHDDEEQPVLKAAKDGTPCHPLCYQIEMQLEISYTQSSQRKVAIGARVRTSAQVTVW
ncbi:hypothetical protein WJX77_009025 [Trebouxia sp. C0004]